MTHNQFGIDSLFMSYLTGTFLSNPIVRAIRGLFGNDGVAVVMHLLDTFRSQGYCLKRSLLLVDVIASDAKVDPETINAVIDRLIAYEVLNPEMAAAGKLTSAEIQETWFKKVRRKKPTADMPDLLINAPTEMEKAAETPIGKDTVVINESPVQDAVAAESEMVAVDNVAVADNSHREESNKTPQKERKIAQTKIKPAAVMKYPNRKRCSKSKKVYAHTVPYAKPQRITIRRFLR